MSLYNMLFGVNPAATLLLKCIGLTESAVPRFRDCYIDDGTHIAVHTRTGGGNRDYYESLERCKKNYPDYFDNENDAPSGPWNKDLRNNPYFVYDEDDDFDNTYATFFYRFPEEYKDDLIALSANTESHKPSEKWQALLSQLKGARP